MKATVIAKETTLEALLTGAVRADLPFSLIDPFRDALPCWHHPQPVPLRNFHREMFSVICGALSGKGPNSVKLTMQGHKFRCVPSADGGVILYKDGCRNQYHHLPMKEWEQWATENHDA